MGLVPANLELTPRSVVPANFINRQTGWADKQNPAWDSLPADRQADLARRMAVYAATIEIMDRNIGRVVAHLKQTGEWNNTLICFLSDNGACAEWDPYGFDKLDSPLNILHTGADLKKVGGPDSYISYGSGWANAGNTPWRLYKHYAQEGGIRTPMIVHWPAGLKIRPGSTTSSLGYVTDFMPTLLQVCGATYPQERNGVKILPTEGESLTPTFQGGKLSPRVLCVEHEGNRMVREGDWKLVALANRPWELYDLKRDPTEMHDRAEAEPGRVRKLSTDWEAWTVRCRVKPRLSPQIAGMPLAIRCDVTPQTADGVILAQGGNKQGYTLYLQGGKPVFGVREDGKLYVAIGSDVLTGRFPFPRAGRPPSGRPGPSRAGGRRPQAPRFEQAWLEQAWFEQAWCQRSWKIAPATRRERVAEAGWNAWAALADGRAARKPANSEEQHAQVQRPWRATAAPRSGAGRRGDGKEPVHVLHRSGYLAAG